jgi:hypothetical protein
VSHRFKQYKPLGKNKRNMKSGSGGSRKQLPTAAGSTEIYDFLYVDRPRISSLYAQLFPQGILTSVKTTALQNFSDESDIGSDIRVLKAESKSTEGGSEGIEQMFDASWSIPLEVLARLRSLFLVHESLKNTGLGSIVLTNCYLRLIDFASMDKLWDAAMRTFMASSQASQSAEQILPAEVVPSIVEALRAMPQVVHAHFLTNDAILWSSLQPANLTIPVSDLTLKYGGVVSGKWNLLYILDAWADKGEPPDVSGWSAGSMMDAILAAMHGIRGMIGRPAGWIGITPLMIYRDVAGWMPPIKKDP